MEYKLDMSMMFAMHDALRRELVQVARTARLRDDHPGRLLHAALGVGAVQEVPARPPPV